MEEATVIESVAYLENDELPPEKEYKDLGREYFDFIYVFKQPFSQLICFSLIARI